MCCYNAVGTSGVGAYKAVTPGSHLTYALIDTDSNTCFGGIQTNTRIGFSIFGDNFIKSQSPGSKGPKSFTLGFAAKALWFPHSAMAIAFRFKIKSTAHKWLCSE